MENIKKEKIHYGDYQLLAEMLRVSSDAVRKRFERGEKEAIHAMGLIQKNRKELVQGYQKASYDERVREGQGDTETKAAVEEQG